MAELLRMLDGVWSGYGDAIVLEDVASRSTEGDSLALLGRNGMGKSTLLATLIGAARQTKGSIRFAGADITRVAGSPARARGHRAGCRRSATSSPRSRSRRT